MRKERVVITGMGAVSPFGEGVSSMMDGLSEGRCALTALPENNGVRGLQCRVAGLAPEPEGRRIPREVRRAMSPMSVYACLAAWEALEQAGLDRTQLPRAGVALGSTLGSPLALSDFFHEFFTSGSVDDVRTTTFFKIMGHTVAANVAMACRCTGRLISPAAACAGGAMAIGLGSEVIAAGHESLMLCGGADEYNILTSATFDRLGAASHEMDTATASRPFDAARSGIVCGEGAGVVVLESLGSARQRGAAVLAEVVGFASVTSPSSIAHPDSLVMRDCMREALDDAGLRPQDIGYVNAHATATEYGDMAEGKAIEDIWGDSVPVSSLKGHMGHTMAASGALESVACVEMLRRGALVPTRGLEQPDPRCGSLALFRKTMPFTPAAVLKNSFALGGVYTALVLSPPPAGTLRRFDE